MPKRENPIPNFDPQETAFHAEAVRGFIHKTALETLEQMHEQGIADGHVALMTGIIEAAVQIWLQTSLRVGVPPKKARETMEAQVRRFWNKWHREEQRGGQPVVAA